MKDDAVFRSVISIPGFGIMSAGYTAAMIDDIGRFENARGYSASLGLTPRLDESADKPKNRGISRRGDPEMGKIMTQAAFVNIFHTESAISEKYRRLTDRGKSRKEALVACANKMARTVWAVVSGKIRYLEKPETLAKSRLMADSDDVEEKLQSKPGPI